MIEQAREFALIAHQGQMYGTKPYQIHLDAVVNIVKPYGEAAQVVAYLHDVVEDTPVTVARVGDIFGEFIATCVAIVTDEAGDNRRQRKDKTHQKMKSVSGELQLALIVKAADRLANMRASVAGKRDELIAMYVAEYLDFKVAVYRKGLCDDLWQALDDIYQSQQ